MKREMLAAAAALVSLTACAREAGLAERQDADRWALEQATPTGEAENCVSLRNVRQTITLDDQTIDFHLTGRRVLRNRLPFACPGLAFEDGFSYRASLDRLCSGDLITVRRSGGPPGPTCGLGRFQPVEIARR